MTTIRARGAGAVPGALFVALSVALAVGFTVALSVAPDSPASSPPAAGRPLPDTLWGVTLDNTADIGAGALSQEVASLAALPAMPITRVVMDVGTKPAAYATALKALHPVTYVMAELGDSSEMRHRSASSYQRFEQALVTADAGSVDLWEVGNEVNGEWVGSSTTEMAKVTDAYDSVTASGVRRR
jgi:hypothetical protein